MREINKHGLKRGRIGESEAEVSTIQKENNFRLVNRMVVAMRLSSVSRMKHSD